MSRPPSPDVLAARVSPHVSMGRATFFRPLSGSSKGLPRRLEYLPLQGVLIPRVYGTTTSPLWLKLRDPTAGQVSSSWTVYQLACHWLLPWLRVTFAMLPDAAWRASDQPPWGTAQAAFPAGGLGCPSASDTWVVVCCHLSPCRPRCASVCGVHGPLKLLHRCALGSGVCLVCCVCGLHGAMALVHRCACCLCSVHGPLLLAHWCARLVCCL